MEPKKIYFGKHKVSPHFRIVYPKGKPVEQYLAEELSKKIFALSEVTVPVVADEDSKREHFEICLGKTNRTTIVPDAKNTYKITVGRYAVEAVSDTLFGYEDVLAALASKMEEEGDVRLELGTCLTGEVTHPVRLTKDDEYSFLFHNIWGYTIAWNPLSNRGDLAMEIYREYMPDIIGFQEVSNPHYEQAANVFAGLKQLGYSEIRFRRFGYGNPIYFNSRKIYPIECGYQRARRGDKNNIWAVFADVDSDKPTFAVVNSHFAADSNANRDHELGNQYRADDARSMLKAVRMIQQHFPGIPVITGGDYNSGMSSEAIRVLLEGDMVNVRDLIPQATPVSPFLAPQYIAEENRYQYCHQPDFRPWEQCIDYVMTYGPTKNTVDFHDYRVLTDDISFLTSDHKPHILYASIPAWEEPEEN